MQCFLSRAGVWRLAEKYEPNRLFRQGCKEQGVGLDGPYGSLPTKDVLSLCELTKCNF